MQQRLCMTLWRIFRYFRGGREEGILEEMIAPSLYSMFVTPKDVDDTIKRLSYTISEGLNFTFEKDKA